MKAQKKCVILLMAAIMISANIFMVLNETEAAAGILVLVDNQPVTFDVPPEIINGRTMVPFRAIGKAMGVLYTDWNDENKTVTMYLNDDFVQLKIGSLNMICGKFSVDTNGSFIKFSQRTQLLDAAPAIVNGRTLVPLGALAQGLGATVRWEDTSRTVTIFSPPASSSASASTATATPVSQVTPTPTPAQNMFWDTAYFTTLTPARIQSMYDNGEKFILVYYDSTTTAATELVPILKDAADYERYEIYGVDSGEDGFNSSSQFSFVYDFVSRRALNASSPAMFFVYGKDNVEYRLYDRLVQINDSRTRLQTANLINDFRNAASATYTPAPTYTPYPTRTPTPSKNLDRFCAEIGQDEAQTKYNQNETFILIVYDGVYGSKGMLEIYKEAAYDARVDVFTIDLTGVWRSGHWIKNYIVESRLNSPVILSVKAKAVRQYTGDNLADITRILSGI